jgi:two-component system chemotaxis response regulator CheY
MKILIVEDESVSREKIHHIMKNFGKCTVAEGGSAGLRLFKEALQEGEPFDLVTLDISMPDIDGKNVLRQIRKAENSINSENYKKTKVIMLTGHADKENIQGSLKAGCDDYLLKPFDKQLVEEKLKNLDLIKRQ